MKKVMLVLFASCLLVAGTYAQTNVNVSKTVTGTAAKTYKLPAATGKKLPPGISGWVVDIKGNDGKNYSNGISAEQAKQINDLLAQGKTPTITVIRTEKQPDKITISN